ncbi:MAG: nucleotide exchange factor GrpE [Bacteroidetes bacterium GWF2_33_16]|nr:MAG: nucleotide exchange factor GrpE [Bacteroidetes bacterium GWE2_32_14]OFY08925.1 MAG: nucleotide exchange factor GrpE [Bacteroidetes bacterium GWF2_33_16]
MTKKEKKGEKKEEETTQHEQESNSQSNTIEEAEQVDVKVEEKKEEVKSEKSDKEKLDELNDKYLRLAAEYDNYRKRTLKEKMELSKSAGADILVNMLPVIDDFERALGHLDQAKDMSAVKDGITLIYNKFSEFLKQRGVKEIEAKEKEFDTDLHEAITKIPAPNDELKGKVVDVVEKGYYLYDKVIRFSKVVIGE